MILRISSHLSLDFVVFFGFDYDDLQQRRGILTEMTTVASSSPARPARGLRRRTVHRHTLAKFIVLKGGRHAIDSPAIDADTLCFFAPLRNSETDFSGDAPGLRHRDPEILRDLKRQPKFG